jgi:hypothetical protein
MLRLGASSPQSFPMIDAAVGCEHVRGRCRFEGGFWRLKPSVTPDRFWCHGGAVPVTTRTKQNLGPKICGSLGEALSIRRQEKARPRRTRGAAKKGVPGTIGAIARPHRDF